MLDAMRRWCGTLGMALVVGGCFDGEELTEGRLCLKNTDCGGTLLCQLDADGVPRCGGEEAMEPAGTDPCEAGGNTCVDSNTLGVCNLADNSTMEVSCDTSCEQSGYSRSLGCHASMGSKHQCYCDQSSSTTTCTGNSCSGNVLLECDGTQVDAYTDCDEVCQATGQVGSCDIYATPVPACSCTSGACSEGATFCQDDNTEVRCIGGVWQPQSCSSAACQQAQCPVDYNSCPEGYTAESLGCGYDSNNANMGCRCTN